MTALWIAAWIAGRLGGTLQQRTENSETKSERFQFQRSAIGQPPLAIDLQLIDLSECAAEPGQAAALAEVEMRAGDAFHFAIERRQDAEFWKLRIAHGDCHPIEELIPARPCGDSALVNEVLSRAGQNRAMRDLLPLLRQLLSA